jgi:hypothetical protein
MLLGALVENNASIIEDGDFLGVTKITRLVVWAGGVEAGSQRRREENLRLNWPSRRKSI